MENTVNRKKLLRTNMYEMTLLDSISHQSDRSLKTNKSIRHHKVGIKH